MCKRPLGDCNGHFEIVQIGFVNLVIKSAVKNLVRDGSLATDLITKPLPLKNIAIRIRHPPCQRTSEVRSQHCNVFDCVCGDKLVNLKLTDIVKAYVSFTLEFVIHLTSPCTHQGLGEWDPRSRPHTENHP